jgi:hypothetical protein
MAPKRFLTTSEVTDAYSVPVKSLETMRTRGGGPVYSKPYGRVLYDRADVEAWLEAGKRQSTSDTAA